MHPTIAKIAQDLRGLGREVSKQNHIRGRPTYLKVSLLILSLVTSSRGWCSRTNAADQSSECEVYTVRRIEIEGNAHTRDRPIRRRIALDEGSPFSEREAEQTIKNLNRWGHFERLSREDMEVTFSTSDQAMRNGTVSLTFVFTYGKGEGSGKVREVTTGFQPLEDSKFQPTGKCLIF